jgi:hypothetical protein
LPSNLPKPCLYSVPGGVLSLSGLALQEFLRAVLARGSTFRFKARGFSMHPFIQDGDVVTVSPLGGRYPRLGEVMAACHSETLKLMVHRVLSRREGGVLLRGDNSPAADGYIPAGKVLGRVTRVERNGQRVRLGLGLERSFVAFLSRHDMLQPLIFRARQVLRPLRRRVPA